MARPSRVALALGSGGARGYAHIGVIAELEARGFEIVTVAGSSMGALVGGLYCAGKLDDYVDWISGLSQLDDKNLNPGEVNAAVTTRVMEAYLRVAKLPAANAAAMAAGDLLAELPDDGDKKSQVLVGSATGVPRVRSKGEVTVEGGNADDNYVSPDGEVYSRDGTLNAAPTSRDTVRTDTEDPNAAFYKLSWEDVRKSTSADTNVDAGTYVVWDDGSLHYYDMNLPEYKAFIESDPTNPGTTVTLDSDAMKYDKKKLTIKQNVFVSSTGNSDEFNLIPRGGAQVTPDDEGGAVGPIPIDELEQAVKRASSLPYTVSSPDNMGAYLDFPTADLSIVPPGSAHHRFRNFRIAVLY